MPPAGGGVALRVFRFPTPSSSFRLSTIRILATGSLLVPMMPALKSLFAFFWRAVGVEVHSLARQSICLANTPLSQGLRVTSHAVFYENWHSALVAQPGQRHGRPRLQMPVLQQGFQRRNGAGAGSPRRPAVDRSASSKDETPCGSGRSRARGSGHGAPPCLENAGRSLP